MEIQFSYSALFTFLCFLFVIRKLISKKSHKSLPPGPKKLPLIGNLHQIGSLPHRSFRTLAKKYGPIMHLQLGQLSYIIVTSKELAKEVMKTHDTIFANRPKFFVGDTFLYNSTDLAFSPYGSYWRQIRKICTLEVLSIKRVRTFRWAREEEVFALVKHISENQIGSVVNLSEQLQQLTNTIISRAAFGWKTKNIEKVLSAFEYVMKNALTFTIPDLYPSLEFLRVINGMKAEAEKVRKDLDTMLDTIINEHVEKKVDPTEQVEEDFVDVLLRIQKENDIEIPLTLDNIKALILDIFIAGTEATVVATEWAMAEMVKNPKILKKAQEEVRRVYGNKGYVDESELHQLTYVAAVIRETLRLHPPGPLLFPRESSEICELNGYKLPAKTKLIVNFWAIARDPEYWNEPEIFRPERFIDSSIDYRGGNFEYMPFGAGRRICPGLSFATAVLDLVLPSLLYHFDWKLPNGKKNEELDMSEIFLTTLRLKNGLCLVPTAYRP
ncbi:hypothetical protein QN277_002312 [Acacia crassicarpa]|uniref:Cytochrome P450 n=1 Tax=Acacia crassicarpa TaxID=499986 RepID=A0AAE1NA81_9FABA|nr:hypothetical protein QN277_002312 [Acacia crassicarpa]